MRRWRVLAVYVALVLSVNSVGAYPIARELEMGERFALEAAGALPFIRDPEVLMFVEHLGQELVGALDPPQPFDYRFHVVKDLKLNAFAVPGGFIFVHSGLVTRAENDAELAGVLGHEVAHSHAHHIVRQQEKSKLANYTALAGVLLSVIQPALGAVALGASAAAQLKYRREFEEEADYLGLRFLRKTGYDPHAMSSFMKKILEEHRTQPLEVPPYLLSHPLTDERITNLQIATRNDVAKEGSGEASLRFQRVQAILRALTEGAEATSSKYEAKAIDGDGLTLLGLVQLHQGESIAAIETFGKAEAAGATGLDGDLGLAFLRAGQLDEALIRLRSRVEAFPEDAVARAYLGEALLVSGLLEEAQKELSLALRHAPMFDQAEFNLGQSYGNSGDKPRGMFHLARAFELRGDIERAISHYERSLEGLEEGSLAADEATSRLERLKQVHSERAIKGRRSK